MELLNVGRSGVLALLVVGGLVPAPASAAPPVTLAVPGRSNANVSVAADLSFVAIVWSAATPSGETDIYATTSRDGGAAFSSPTRVNSRAGEASVSGEQAPRVALVRHGGVVEMTVLWTAKHAAGTALLTARSTDAGRSFSPSAPVPGTDAPGNRGWEAIESDASGRIHAVWLDPRAGVRALVLTRRSAGPRSLVTNIRRSRRSPLTWVEAKLRASARVMSAVLAADNPLQEDRLSVEGGLSGVVLTFARPWPRSVTRRLSAGVLLLWTVQMAALVNRSYLHASPNLATDLARYGSNAQWRGVYYRGEKIGFTVSQTVPVDDGFELQEDGQLQMTLLGATTLAQLRTTARVDDGFALRSFAFSLDAGTGPVEVRGRVNGRLLALDVVTASGTRTEERELAETPMLTLNLSRRLASGGLTSGAKYEWTVFDPATLHNAPVVVEVGQRELVRAGNTSIPAFRIGLAFAGLQTTSWMTDTGEVIREESPLGLISIKESADQARAMAVPKQGQTDLLQAAAVVPVMKDRIDDPRDVRRLRLRLEGADLSHPDLQGAGQSVADNVIEIRDPRGLGADPADLDVQRYLAPEPFIESDAVEIVAETERAVGGVTGTRARAEALTRYVNGLLEKKPTVSLPSAREVLRTKVGDCNEHTALYVAMARAAGIPARVAVGLVYVRGAFYYHAWPEVYLNEGTGRGLWLPVDPTFNQFPADATHLRLARGGLDRQAAILPMIGHLKMTVLDLELAPGSTPILIGAPAADIPALAAPAARGGGCRCASTPRP